MYIPRLLAAAGLALMSVPAAAQQVGNFDVTTNETGIESPLLTLSISGSASAKPDLVIIGGGVSTSSTDPGQAMVQNNAVSEKIVAAIRRLGIADKDIQTSSISLGRDYEEEYVDAGTAADGTAEATAIAAGDIRIPGKARRYRAANTVVIRLRDIAMAGKVVNILVENGANNVNGPNFSIEDDTPLLDKARAQALDKAANLSAQYAQKTGFTRAALISITDVNEQGGIYNAYEARSYAVVDVAADAAGSAPAVEAGEVSRSVKLVMKYRLVR